LNYMRRLVVAASRPDETGDHVTSSGTSFMRVSYWCDSDKTGPFMIETNRMYSRSNRSFQPMMSSWETLFEKNYVYTRVLEVIAVAESILTEVPSTLVRDTQEEQDRSRK